MELVPIGKVIEPFLGEEISHGNRQEVREYRDGDKVTVDQSKDLPR